MERPTIAECLEYYDQYNNFPPLPATYYDDEQRFKLQVADKVIALGKMMEIETKDIATLLDGFVAFRDYGLEPEHYERANDYWTSFLGVKEK